MADDYTLDGPDFDFGSDPLGLEGITHAAQWDNPDVEGDVVESVGRYGLRPRDAEGNQLPERGFLSQAGESIAETIPYILSLGAFDPEFSGQDMFGGRYGDLSSLLAGGTGEQPAGTLDATMPFGSLPGLAGLLVPTARFGKEGASMHGGVTGPVKFLADVIASPVETFKRAKEQLTDPTPVKDPWSAIKEKALDIYSTTIPDKWDPKSEPQNLGGPDNLGGGPQNVPLPITRVDPVEETSSQSQTTASVNEKKPWQAPENLEGPEPLSLIKKPLSVAARLAAPVEPSLAEPPPVQGSRTYTDFAGDYSTYGLGLPHRFFEERHPVTAEGGGLMDLQRQADTLASQGRGGDTMLVHMRPDEVAGLASLGTVTRNPVTGLPENFLGPALGALLGGAFMGPGASWLTSALATGAGAGAGQYLQSKMLGEDDPLRRGLMAGLTAGVGSAALGGFGEAFGTTPDVKGVTGVGFGPDKGPGMGWGTGLENLGNKARTALSTNLGTTSGLMGSVGGIGADADAQQRLATRGQGEMPIREASTYRGTDNYGAPRLSPRVPTGLDQADLRTYGFGPEQQFFGPRVRAEGGGNLADLADEALAKKVAYEDLIRSMNPDPTIPRGPSTYTIPSEDLWNAGFIGRLRTNIPAIERGKEFDKRQAEAEDPKTSALRRDYYNAYNDYYNRLKATRPESSAAPFAPYHPEMKSMIDKGLSETQQRKGKEAGGPMGEDFATSGIQALLAFRDQNASDLQQGIDERVDPRYLEDTQDMTLTPPEGGDGLAASIVDQAIAALKGDHPQGDTAISNFIKEFGEEAFASLRSLIMQELQAEEMAGDGGLLRGSDGGRDDLRRVKIDGIQDGNVSSGEYLWSADDTSLAGGGNTEAGARRLDMARKKLREKAYGTAQRPNYIGEEEVEEVFEEVMTA